MDRITMRPVDAIQLPQCWNCGATVSGDRSAARYLYRGPQKRTMIVEDWLRCGCGAFQNVQQVKEIHVSRIGRREKAS